jgi:hypothetical protein
MSDADSIGPTHRELKREKAWSRIHLIPLLEAENDRDKYRRAVAEKTVEGAIMHRHKGWKVCVFLGVDVLASAEEGGVYSGRAICLLP